MRIKKIFCGDVNIISIFGYHEKPVRHHIALQIFRAPRISLNGVVMVVEIMTLTPKEVF